MAYKVLIIDDKKVNKEVLDGVIHSSIDAGIVDGFARNVPAEELAVRLKKACEFIATGDEITKKIEKIKEERDVLIKFLSGSVQVPFSFIVIKPSGDIEWVNDGFSRIHGFELPEHLECHGSTIFSVDPASEIGNLFNKCLAEASPINSICRVKAHDGTKLWLQVFFNPQINAEGKIDEIIAVEIDITKFRNKEDELHAQNEKIKEIARILEKTNVLLEEQKQEINSQKQTIELEQEKSEKLLLNILPFEVAKQLKSKGRAGTRSYKLVSVLFADFKGFSRISKTLDPKDLVNILDSYFATFDEITGRHYIEKIKTIGDAYMCAGGLPLSNKSNPVDAVLAGLEIQSYLNALNDTKVLNNLQVWELRIGIHTGPVVAGVVGKKRFAYDIWGDTVNVASRMEQGGHVGMVNISGITYDYIKDFFDCDYRGKIETKNLGKIDMYFVNRIKPEFSQDKLGILPNELMMNYVNKL
ncbi:MAG TPA: adenylate/guanylate cyclase domain-containing protein [Bacteroidales bacterium]|nr:adenylate/guanylate cyclase domain-containing protein [Bacteroidales bacterium]